MHFDVVVIGAGVMGTSTALALARRGVNVALLEQFTVGHDRGSSHGRSRIFRLSYPDPEYVGMAIESLALWREYEDLLGETLLTTTGGLDKGAGVAANARALSDCGVTFELLDGRALRDRFPMISVDHGDELLFQPDGGIAHAGTAVKAFLNGARAAGASVIEKARARALESSGDDVVILCDRQDIVASTVIVTAGAWARRLLMTIGIDLPVTATCETVCYFALPEGGSPTLVEWGDPAIYALPSPGEGIKVGEHIAGPVVDPDDAGPDWMNVDSVARVIEWVQERWPTAGGHPHRIETCLYTNAPNERFILERHGRIVVGSPCSGHGFKFAPLIGKRLADLALA